LKEEAQDRTMWRARFGRGFGPVVRQTTKWMNVVLYIEVHETAISLPFFTGDINLDFFCLAQVSAALSNACIGHSWAFRLHC
jgi:hypothetical protein